MVKKVTSDCASFPRHDHGFKAPGIIPRSHSSAVRNDVQRFLRYLRNRLFDIPEAETSCTRRGFKNGEPGMRMHIEEIGRTFLRGYRAAIESDRSNELAARLNALPPAFQGFAFEGAAMGLALLDRVTPWKKNRFHRFLHGPGRPHIYMLHVGVGWLHGRFPFSIQRTKALLDPLLCWLALDGYGFHEGYFHWPRYLDGTYTPSRLKGYDRRCFDQGLGRSLWFVMGGDAKEIPARIGGFPEHRRADLWSGIGLACTYAGEIQREALASLKSAAGAYRPQLAQGAAFAAKARLRAGNPTEYTQWAVPMLCGLPFEQAADITDQAKENLPLHSNTPPSYEIWRQRIQARFQDAKHSFSYTDA